MRDAIEIGGEKDTGITWVEFGWVAEELETNIDLEGRRSSCREGAGHVRSSCGERGM